MTPEMKAELARMRIEDDKWDGPKLLMMVATTVTAAFIVIYFIAGMNSQAW